MTLKAVILVGGPSSGTRFRPLSMDCPTPLFPIAGNPTIYHHVQALAKVPGMKEIFLIGFWDQNVFDRFLVECQIEFPHISLRYLREYQAMGTAGGLYHFRDEILRGSPEAFFVLNADIASSFPLDTMLKAHRKHSATAGTIMTIKVDKSVAHKFGCVVYDTTTLEIQHYVEKPESFVSDVVSCGVYVFSDKIFDSIAKALEEKQTAAEYMGIDLTQFTNLNLATINSMMSRASDKLTVQLESDVLRHLTNKGMLFAFVADKKQFWMPVKTGSSTILANRSYLQWFMQAHPRRLSTPIRRAGSIRDNMSAATPAPPLPTGNVTKTPLSSSPGAEVPRFSGPELIAPVYIHPTAVVHPSARIGPNVSIGTLINIGPRALVGHGARIREAIILDSVEIKNDACIINAVIGWETKIGSWARIEGMPEYKEEKEGATDQGYKRPTASILGKAVVVGDELMVRDCIVLPHKEIKRSFHREIIM